MNFKEYFTKRLIPYYAIIVALINIAQAIFVMLFHRVDENISIYSLVVPPAFGAIGCIPLLIDYLFMKKRSSTVTLLLYNGLELILLEACIFAAAFFLRMIKTVTDEVILATMVLSIFAVISGLMYMQDKKLCSDINGALAGYSGNSIK